MLTRLLHHVNIFLLALITSLADNLLSITLSFILCQVLFKKIIIQLMQGGSFLFGPKFIIY